MSARQKSTQKSTLIILAAAALLVIGGVFFFKSSNSGMGSISNTSNTPATVNKTVKPMVVNNNPVATATPAMSGPVGRNALRAYAGPGVGQVTLEWQRFFIDGENYSVHYGTATNSYNLIADHIGYISTYTINGLTPGSKYFFAVEGFRTGNVSAGWDGEVSVVAPSLPTTVVGTAGPVGRNMLVAKAGPKKGQVTLSWVRFFPDTELYNVVYGVLPGVYSFGSLNAVDTTPQDSNYSFVVSSLTSGKRYYFALDPQRSGTGIYITSEVSVVAP